MDASVTIGTWVGAILTFCVLSLLYKENPAFRLVEHIIVGLGAGYFVVWGMKNVDDIALTAIQKRGEYAYFVPVLLGVLFYFRISKKYSWMSRWSIAVIVGTATGLFMRGTVAVELLDQIVATGKSIIAADPMTSFNNLLIAALAIFTVTYFIYTKEQKGSLGVTAKLGRYAMMASFGAIFGGMVVSRMATMIGVIQFLLFDWLGLK